MTDKQCDPWEYIPTSYIKRDKDIILDYHKGREGIREAHKRMLESKKRVTAIKKIENLINEWKIKPDELFEAIILEEGIYIRDEEPDGSDWSEEGLANSKRIHDALDIDYKCKVCFVRGACCKFSNAERLERDKECDGVSQLLNSKLADDVRDYLLEIGSD